MGNRLLWVNSLLRELRQALRALGRSPETSAAVVASLALGIGACTLVYAFLDALFFEPLPVTEPETLVAVFSTEGDKPDLLPFSWKNFEDLNESLDAFSGVAAALDVSVAFDGGGGTERAGGLMVSGDYFEVLGLTPAAGRFFRAEEKRTAVPVAVLSHGLWQRRFAADPAIVGSTVRINRQPFTVVGVAPAGFRGLEVLAPPPELWLPSTLHRQLLTGRAAEWFERREALMASVVARLAPGVSRSRAAAALATAARQLEAAHPATNEDLGFALLPLGQTTIAPSERGRYLRSGTLLAAAVGLLLGVAVINVANLMTVRALARRRETALRLALGAGRGRLAGGLLLEGVLLALAGGAAGLVLALWGRGLLDALRPPFLPESFELAFDGRVVAFTLAVALGTGLLFSLAPLAQSLRLDLAGFLTRQVGSGPAGPMGSGRGWLVALQVALSLIVLFGAGLFLRSLGKAEAVDLGFDSEGLFALPIALPPEVDPERGRQLFRDAVERVGALPGVRSAAVASRLLLVPGGPHDNVEVPGLDRPEIADVLVGMSHVGPGYFATAGIPLERGRDFTPADREGSVPVAVVNDTMASWLWPGRDAVGERFRFRGEEEILEVVGVAGDAVYGGLGEPPRPYLYLPLDQRYLPVAMLHVRTPGEPAALIPAVRREVARLDPDLPLLEPRTLAELRDRALWAPRMGAGLLTLFGTLATVLAAVGVYGVVAYAVRRRDREIGIRLALGAERRQVLALVFAQGMRPVAAGLAAGVLAALAASRRIANLLFGIGAADPASLAAAVLLLAAVAAAAVYLPARRASGLDPAIVLEE